MDKINGLKVGLFCENQRVQRDTIKISRRPRRFSQKSLPFKLMVLSLKYFVSLLIKTFLTLFVIELHPISTSSYLNLSLFSSQIIDDFGFDFNFI
jgi:hypothetical protein